MPRSAAFRTSLWFLGLAAACLLLSDIEITTRDPWFELGRMMRGALTPDFFATEQLASALLHTVAFAATGVGIAVLAGFCLALVFHVGAVRWGCAFLRAIHELFWALIFLQMFGLSPLTGVLAIAIPYSAICAKVFAEILEEADATPLKALPAGSGILSGFFYARLPPVWQHMKTYALYRLECGMRSSAVLGFVGLPTLGFHLQTAFQQGQYSEVSALLYLFFLLISTLRLWVRPRLVPLLFVLAILALPPGMPIAWENALRFLTADIVPAPLRAGALLDAGTLGALGRWMGMLLRDQALPGMVATLLLSQVALVGTGLLTLVFFPLISRHFFGPVGRTAGHVFLVIARSTPEYILTFTFLQAWGPSMLPAIVALALHNGAIIGHLTGRHADAIPRRPDSPRGLNLYGFEVLPRVYGQFLAFLFYRWEVILRETAILGMLGIHTLGFFIDNALSQLRLDRMMFLLLVTAVMNVGIDILSRRIRANLRLTVNPETGE
ncbi:MAG: ABC transporter permease [Candidatus Lambdaproteobacteria bacterium]|nr:ABC transporter permease [Candidatus Lambdaproteobacteria bacterium]